MHAFVAATAAVALLGSPAYGYSPQDSTRSPLHRFELENGLEVVVAENHAAPLATVLVGVRSGAFVQTEGEQGISHLCEHLVFSSYGGDPTDFGSDAADLNAYYNGSTSSEVVTYMLVLPSDEAEKGVRLLNRLVTDAKFRGNDIGQARAVVLDELERSQSDPENALTREVEQKLWGDSWHRRNVLGDSLLLAELTTDDLNDHYKRYYVPNNAVLIVTGDVAPPEVLRAAERHFGDWETGEDPFAGALPTNVAPLTGSQAVLVGKSIPDVTIRMETHGIHFQRDVDATYAADALFAVLNDPDSEFQRQLVGSGLFKSIVASYSTMSEYGPIRVVGKTTIDDAHDALMALNGQLDSLDLLVGVTEEELAIAKKYREVGSVLAREQIATLAPNIAFWWAATGLDYYVEHGDNVNAQTLEDLGNFAREYVVGQPRIIGVLGPGFAVARIAEWLNNPDGLQ